jgi:hypothetical protein
VVAPQMKKAPASSQKSRTPIASRSTRTEVRKGLPCAGAGSGASPP